MQRKNLFDGESYKAEFAIITYRWLMSRRWVTNADIMAERLGCSIEELPANLSNCDGYGELKKIVGIVKKAIREKLGFTIRMLTIASRKTAIIRTGDSVT